MAELVRPSMPELSCVPAKRHVGLDYFVALLSSFRVLSVQLFAKEMLPAYGVEVFVYLSSGLHG